MLFILGLSAVMALIILFCMAMEKRDASRGRSEHTKSVTYDRSTSAEGWDPLDPADGYNDCPYCGSGDTDGSHCYDCDEDY